MLEEVKDDFIKFQFLIGRLGTLSVNLSVSLGNKFQFLIGRLGTFHFTRKK